jgi:hypothetical protein
MCHCLELEDLIFSETHLLQDATQLALLHASLLA